MAARVNLSDGTITTSSDLGSTGASTVGAPLVVDGNFLVGLLGVGNVQFRFGGASSTLDFNSASNIKGWARTRGGVLLRLVDYYFGAQISAGQFAFQYYGDLSLDRLDRAPGLPSFVDNGRFIGITDSNTFREYDVSTGNTKDSVTVRDGFAIRASTDGVRATSGPVPSISGVSMLTFIALKNNASSLMQCRLGSQDFCAPLASALNPFEVRADQHGNVWITSATTDEVFRYAGATTTLTGFSMAARTGLPAEQVLPRAIAPLDANNAVVMTSSNRLFKIRLAN